jgi:general stress protein YciG
MSSAENNPGNFANRPTEEVRNIASKGGKASGRARSADDQFEEQQQGENISSRGKTSGTARSGENLYEEETPEATSGSRNTNPGNFANRPAEEVREIASKGGKASSGSFEPGSERAREAGRKGGLQTQHQQEEDI